MMKTTHFFQFSFLFSLLLLSSLTLLTLPPSEAAAGIRLPSAEARTFFFEPGKEYEWTWHVYGANELEVYLGGTLEEYGYFEDRNPNGGPRDITFGLRLPQEIEPGEHTLLLYVQEGRPEGAMVGGVARVGGRITIISLYPDPYMEAGLSVADVSVSEDTQAQLTLTSWSEETITASARIDIKNLVTDEIVHTQQTSSVSLASREKNTITTNLQTANLEPGRYQAIAHVQGGQDDLEAKNNFLIGRFDVSLVEYTSELRPDAVNRFRFTAQSNWNEDITNVYGMLTLLNRTELTPSNTIRAGLHADFSTFIDLEGVDYEGPVEANLKIVFGEESREFPITINLSRGALSAEERPSAFSFELNHLTAIYAVLLLLVLINVLLLFKKKKE